MRNGTRSAGFGLQSATLITRRLADIPRHDRRWFRAHPERRHRCRRPDAVEIDFYETDYGRLIMAIRHMGARRLAYQPVIHDGTVPPDERSAAVLFALATRHPDPIPVVAESEVIRLRYLFPLINRPTLDKEFTG